MSLGSHPATRQAALPRSDRLAAGIVAVLLGTLLLFATGFAQANLLHDAAHDTRHGFTFPCH